MLGKNRDTGEKVALKIMKNNQRKGADQIKAMYESEISALKQLEHENIVKLYDYSDCEKVINAYGNTIEVSFIAVEYAENGEFFDYIAEGPKFSEEMTRYFFHKIIDTLEYMHNNGIAHRDIKPENLLLDRDFNLKFGDFGFATNRTFTSGRRGTFGYMAPEVLGGLDYDPKMADLFSAAVILFIMMTKHCPFIRADINDKYYKNILNGDYERFWQMHGSSNGESKEFSDSFKDLFGRMISQLPCHRLSIEEIKAHDWYNGPVWTQSDIQHTFTTLKMELQKDKEISEKKEENWGNTEKVLPDKQKSTESSAKTSADTPTADVKMDSQFSEHTVTEYYKVKDGDILVDIITWFCDSLNLSYIKSSQFYRVTLDVSEGETSTTIEANILKKKKDGSRAIELKLLEGDKRTVYSIFTKLSSFLKLHLAELDN